MIVLTGLIYISFIIIINCVVGILCECSITELLREMNMPKCIERLTSENEIEIRNLSMLIMKCFEIRYNLY